MLNTSLQILIVSDVAAGVLFDDAVELGLSQVLHLPLSVSPPFLRHHGLLQSQVAAGDLAEGDNSQKLFFRVPSLQKVLKIQRFKYSKMIFRPQRNEPLCSSEGGSMQGCTALHFVSKLWVSGLQQLWVVSVCLRGTPVVGWYSPVCPAVYCQRLCCCCLSWKEPPGRWASSSHPRPPRSYRTPRWKWHTHARH